MEKIRNNFEEKIAYTKITYVIAKYSKVHKCWFHQYEYEEIEEAQDKLKYLNKHIINYQYLSDLDFKDLLKIFFYTISNIDYDFLSEASEYLNDVFDKINELVVDPFEDLLNDLLYFVEENRIDEIFFTFINFSIFY